MLERCAFSASGGPGKPEAAAWVVPAAEHAPPGTASPPPLPPPHQIPSHHHLSTHPHTSKPHPPHSSTSDPVCLGLCVSVPVTLSRKDTPTHNPHSAWVPLCCNINTKNIGIQEKKKSSQGGWAWWLVTRANALRCWRSGNRPKNKNDGGSAALAA